MEALVETKSGGHGREGESCSFCLGLIGEEGMKEGE